MQENLTFEDYKVFYIPRSGGRTRRICAPSEELKKKQRELIPALYEEFAYKSRMAGVPHVFHGFLPGRSPVTAAKHHTGYETTLTMDISNFFDSVQYEGSVNAHIVSVYDGSLGQGFCTSPILANMYLIKPMAEIRKFLDLLGIPYALTVYADDIQMSFTGINYAELATIQKYVAKVLSDYKLDIHPHKTRIRHAKHGYRYILGLAVSDHIKPSRKLLRKIRAAEHQNNGPSLGGLRSYSNQVTWPKNTQ